MAKLNIRKNVLTTVAAFFINIILTFIGYRLLIGKSGTAALGLWAALSAAIYIIRIGDVGMGSAIERQIAIVDISKDSVAIRRYLDTGIVVNTILFMLLATVGWIVISLNISWVVPANIIMQREALYLLPLMLVVFIVSNISNVIVSGLRGIHLVYISAYLSICGALFQFVVILILVPRMSVVGLAWGQLIQYVFVGSASWWIINKELRKYEKKLSWMPVLSSKLYLKELVRFSLKVQAVNFINGLFEPIAKFMVGHSSGMSTLGIFEIAYKVVTLPRHAIVSGVIGMSPAMTKLITSDRSEAMRLYKRAKKIVCFLTAGVLTLVVLSSPLISFIVLKNINFDMVIFAAILAIGFWANAIGAPAYTLGFSFGRIRGNLFSALLAVFVLILSSWFLSLFVEDYGVVISCAVSLILSGLLILKLNEELLNGDKCRL